MGAPLVIIPGDYYYLLITALVTIGLQLTCFFIAYVLQFDKLTDLAGRSCNPRVLWLLFIQVAMHV